MIALRVLLGVLVASSWVYWILCVDSARRWRRRSPLPTSLVPHPSSLLPASILKPLRGDDPEQYDSFRTFCEQDYPKYEILFGALDQQDPGLAAACRLAAQYPDRRIEVVAGGEVIGANLKVCTLESLTAAADHDLLVVCDSDMRVGPDYLRRVTAPFSDSSVGLVTCPYRGLRPVGIASILEALGIGADFIPSVLLTERFWGTSFAFGSTIAIRREALKAIGGFESLANELADDYRLGMGVKAAGWRIVLSDYVVDDVLGRESLSEMWSRRLRWARTTRALQPAGWAGALVTHGVALAVLLAAASGSAPWTWRVLAATLVLRGICAVSIGRSTGDRNPLRFLPLLPLSDLVSFALWIASFLGSTVTWRGRRYRIGPRGRLQVI